MSQHHRLELEVAELAKRHRAGAISADYCGFI
jgi:hypothetical protein